MPQDNQRGGVPESAAHAGLATRPRHAAL